MVIALKLLLALYILSSLLKFAVHFGVKYETRITQISKEYSNNGKFIAWFDDIILLFVLLLLGMLLASGRMEYLSFTTGLLIGMTLIQVYFHRFNHPLAEDRSPPPPVTPIKLISFAIQDNPGRAWREYLLMTVLLIWTLVMMFRHDFGG